MSSPHRIRGSRARLRVWSVLVLGLFVVGQVSFVAHRALVQHDVCPVDGELAHGGHGHGHDEAQGDEVDPRGLALEARSAGDDHAEHCLLVTLRDPSTPPDGSVAPRVVPAADPRETTACLPSDGGGIPILQFAPKQSPPRAG